MCEYCEKGRNILTFDESQDFEGYVHMSSTKLVVSNDYGLFFKPINYCMMCGKKLRNEEEK